MIRETCNSHTLNRILHSHTHTHTHTHTQMNCNFAKTNISIPEVSTNTINYTHFALYSEIKTH